MFAAWGSLPGNSTLSTLGLKLSSKVSFLMPFFFFFFLPLLYVSLLKARNCSCALSLYACGWRVTINNKLRKIVIFWWFFFSIYQYHTFINLGKSLKFVTSKRYTHCQSIKKKQNKTANHLNALLENKTERASCIFSKTQTSNGHE